MKPQLEAAARPEALPRPAPEQPYCCKACGQAITRLSCRQERGGSHEHTFRNPFGYSFHVLCFGQAPGCRLEGPASREASWFPDTAWRLALCNACSTHLGWHYEGAESFFGLIATRLVQGISSS